MVTLTTILAFGAAVFVSVVCEMLAAENRALRTRNARLNRENDSLVGDLLKVCGDYEQKAPAYHREAMPCERN